MKITNVHRSSAIELRFTIEDGERSTVRYLLVSEEADPTDVAEIMAMNINHYLEMKADGFPYDYNEAEHIAGILKDAGRYGCD